MKSICLIILSVFANNVFAGSVSVPNTFQPNTPAASGQVNANFDALVVAVNAMQAQIDAQALTIAQLQSDLAAAQGQIAALESNTVLALDGFLSLDLHNGQDVALFDSINVQVTNGLGATNGDPGAPTLGSPGPVNGLGNLIIGYDEPDLSMSVIVICSDGEFDNQLDCEANGAIWAANQKTGSHNLIVGAGQSYTRHGGLLAGFGNAVNRRWSSVVAGLRNVASGPFSTVGAGIRNVASGLSSSVAGGVVNDAGGDFSTVAGGLANIASGTQSSVSGGSGRTASGTDDWVAGSLFEDN